MHVIDFKWSADVNIESARRWLEKLAKDKKEKKKNDQVFTIWHLNRFGWYQMREKKRKTEFHDDEMRAQFGSFRQLDYVFSVIRPSSMNFFFVVLYLRIESIERLDHDGSGTKDRISLSFRIWIKDIDYHWSAINPFILQLNFLWWCIQLQHHHL